MSLKVNESIVVNEDGTPADYFVFSVNEKVNVGNYSSVDTFASLGRYIPSESLEEGRQEVIETVEEILKDKREELIQTLDS